MSAVPATTQYPHSKAERLNTPSLRLGGILIPYDLPWNWSGRPHMSQIPTECPVFGLPTPHASVLFGPGGLIALILWIGQNGG